MKKFWVWIIFFILLSSTWIFNVSINPKDTELLLKLRKDLRFKNIIFTRNTLSSLEDRYNIIFVKVVYIPWGIYLNYEKERTLIYIEYQGKNFFYNQKYRSMEEYIPFDGTIKIIGSNDIDKIKEIIDTYKEYGIKKIVFYDKYLDIYTKDFVLKLGLNDMRERKKYILEISKHMNLKNKVLDFRFRIPTIGGL